MNNDKRVKELEDLILKNKRLYYLGKSEISDTDYDKLEEELREIDPENHVLSVVGLSLEGAKIPHYKKMLSLQKTYDLADLLSWIDNEEVISTEKIDGSSCSLIYKNGELVIAKTRGDGSFGEDITSKVINIADIPKIIPLKSFLEIRGEIFCTDENFKRLTIKMQELGYDAPNSMRNIVAGLLGRKESIELSQCLSFKAFDFMTLDESEILIKTEVLKFKQMKNLGFITPEVKIHKTIQTVEEALVETQEFMENGNYLIDGIVFSYNNLDLHSKLGETSHHPRYKIAFKFSGEAKKTRIREIAWQVSRNGILTPVAEVDIVEVSGANVSRVTLHNLGVVEAFKLKKNDQIEIERSGEVIPKFIKVIQSSSDPFFIPTYCPSCSSETVKDDIRLRCPNEDCLDRKIESTKHFLKVVGIDDLSGERIKDLYIKNLIKHTYDIFLLNEETLVQNAEGYKDKLAKKIISNIQKNKKIPLLKFLVALGISGGGKNMCEKVLQYKNVTTIDDVLSLNAADLMSIEGFAEKSSNDFMSSLLVKKNEIEGFVESGVIIGHNAFDETTQELMGYVFCITGTLSTTRAEVESWIKKRSGKIASSVNKKTSYLVTNDVESTSSKYQKAKELNIPILTEEELNKMVL